MAKTIKFPDNMLFGVGSSAYQIEGGWNAAKKSPSVWDDFLHEKELTESVPLPSQKKKQNFIFKGIKPQEKSNFINGDIACDSYHKVDEDVKNLVDLGVDVYRFSICWPRVLPNGDSRTKNEEGIKYYHTLIDKLLENNIKPLVTIYHWDLPGFLLKIGGLSNPNIVDYFVDYATFLFEEFGEKVKLWCTINEPRLVSTGYGTYVGGSPPDLDQYFNGIGDYMTWRNLLLAHAAIYRAYKKTGQKGEITLALDTPGFFPKDPNNEDDQKACSKGYDYIMGVFIQPLINGEFPKSVIDSVEKTNKNENMKLQRLIPFTDEEKKNLIGSYDFLSFNYYFSYYVSSIKEDENYNEQTSGTKDMGFSIDYNNQDIDLEMTFKGFTEVINWYTKTCNNPTLFISENGISGAFDKYDLKLQASNNRMKIQYHHGILTELHKAIENGVNFKGYSVWSFMDSLEWATGYYKSLYGIYAVDFQDPKRPRSKKPSFGFFEKLFKTKVLPSIDFKQS